MGSWAWVCGHGFVGMGSWAWVCGHGFVGMDLWAWVRGYGFVGMIAIITVTVVIITVQRLRSDLKFI